MKDMKSFNEFLGESYDPKELEALMNESVDQNSIDEAIDAFIKKANEEGYTLQQLQEELANEGFIGSILGGLTGFALGQAVGRMVANALGVEKGLLFDLMTSRIIGAAIGYHLGKRI